jgi:hypothetical protein
MTLPKKFVILDQRSLGAVGCNFLKKWKFAFLLAFIMLAFEYTAIFGILALTPPNHTWLGATISNSSDTAVYLNYINQAASSPLLQNYYAGADHIARFDPFWSLGGLIVKLGASPIQAHEILRILTTIFLAFAIYATAKSVTKTNKDSQIASWLIIAGTSTGWLYSVYMSITNSWAIDSLVPSDLSNEFAIAPILLGGAHMILSPALLLLNTRWIWQIITGTKSNLILPWALIAAHVSFHPYYIPIYGIISLIALFYNYKSKPFLKFLILNSAMLPGAIYYFTLILKDSKLREHHLVTNTLLLDPIWMWLITLLPIIIAFIWILWNKSKIFFDNNTWVWVWLISAIICMILPLPWNRKFAQALLPALVILTLPFWLYIYHNLKPKTDIILKISLIAILSFPFLHLLQSQLSLATDPSWFQYFYTSNQTLNTWNKLKDAPDNSLTISTNLYTCLWSPAYTNKQVWIAHAHETPNFKSRLNDYNNWRHTTSSIIFNEFLDNNQITHVMTHHDKHNQLFDDSWQLQYQEKDTTLWTRKN